MADLAVQSISRAGYEPTYAAADVAGDAFPNSGKEFIHVLNGDVSSHTVTVAIVRQIDGLSPTARVVTVPASEDRMIGPFPTGDYNDGDGKVNWTYDAVTSVTVGVFRAG